MVLAEFGNRISNALRKMTNSTILSPEVIDEMLKEITNALVMSDVNLKQVLQLRTNLKKELNIETMAAGTNKRNIIKKAVFDELCKLLDPGVEPYKLIKGKANVVLFVGLQGNGKTTTIGKYAHHYKRKGWKPAMLCADTFRAGAFDQLMQNAAATKVHFYGSRTERDPVVIAREGIKKLKADPERFDLIMVDTSGRHKQETELFKEMQEIVEAIKPDQIIFVMDGSIGQAAYDQAQAFRNSVNVGAVIITKLDGHAKGGGALSAVAATNSPIIFIGTGERMENLEVFEHKPFISKLLGWGDWKGIADIIKNAVPQGQKAEELTKRIQSGKFTFRDLYSQFEMILNMGPMSQVLEKLPGFSQISQSKGDEGSNKVKSCLVIMDSMTDQELDYPKLLNQSRIIRISRGSGKSIALVNELLVQHKTLEKLLGSGLGKIRPPTHSGSMTNSQIARMVPSNVLKQVGGVSGINNLMKQFGGMGNMFN